MEFTGYLLVSLTWHYLLATLVIEIELKLSAKGSAGETTSVSNGLFNLRQGNYRLTVVVYRALVAQSN